MRTIPPGKRVFFQPGVVYICFAIIALIAFFTARLTTETFNFYKLLASTSLAVVTGLFLYQRYPEQLRNSSALLLLYLLCSLPYLIAPPLLSDDIERYIWEGYIQNQGYNPYALAPANDIFKDETLNRQVNHPHLPAVYPPLSQLIFRLLAAIDPAYFLFKLFFVACGFILLLVMFRRREEFGDAFILVGLFPFLIIETAWSGHLDVVGVLLFAAAIYFFGLVRKVRSYRPELFTFMAGLFLGAAVMIKFLPILSLPILLRKLWEAPVRSDAEAIYKKLKLPALLLAGVGAPLLLYLPYLDAGGGLFFSLRRFSTDWIFSGFFYSGGVLLGLAGEKLRIASALIVMVGSGIIFWRKHHDLYENIFLTLLLLVIFSPIVYPRYLIWLLPFVGRKYFYTMLGLFCAAFLSYSVLDDWILFGLWKENHTVTVASYMIVMIIFISEYFRYKISYALPWRGEND